MLALLDPVRREADAVVLDEPAVGADGQPLLDVPEPPEPAAAEPAEAKPAKPAPPVPAPPAAITQPVKGA